MLSSGSRDEYYHRLRYLEPTAGFRDIFQYNNFMYMVAGILVGRLSGGSWEEFVAERIFKALGLKRSNFSVLESKRDNDYSQPDMTFSGDPVKVPFRNMNALGPAGREYWSRCPFQLLESYGLCHSARYLRSPSGSGRARLEHFHFDVFKGTTSDFYLPTTDIRFHLGNGGTVESFSMPLQSGVADIDFKRLESENKEM